MGYVSSFCSRFHKWFVEMGYPTLDIVEYRDGSWAIIEMLNAPVIPCLTRWQVVLADIRHQEINQAFLKHWIPKIDLHGKAFWAREKKKTDDMLAEKDAVDRHREDHAERAKNAIVRNPALMERVCKGGGIDMSQINLTNIVKHIPPQKLGLRLRSYNVGRGLLSAGKDLSTGTALGARKEAGSDL